MRITEFREKVKEARPNMNKVEQKRLDTMTNRALNSNLRQVLGREEVTESNISKVWHEVNIIEAKADAFHRQQTHMMRTSKSSFIDYSDTAYNNHTDDL